MSGHQTESNIENPKTLAEKITKELKVKVFRCYQCGKCSAGCPIADEMDYPPSLILRMIQTGEKTLEEKVLSSYTIWLCLTCETCLSRCPMEVDMPALMDFLRRESLKRKLVNKKAKDILAFHKAFLDTLENHGKLYEIGLIANYKFRTLHLLQDISSAPKMFFKGKLGLLPEETEQKHEVARIFNKTLFKEEEH